MKTFYSILYCTIRPNLDEKVSIGFFLGNENGCKFQFSSEKLHVIKDLFSETAFNTIKLQLKSLVKLSSDCEHDDLKVYKGSPVFKEQYFHYLSRYSNNLITYSEPQYIDVELNTSNFNKLFEKFIFSLPLSVDTKIKPIEKAKKQLVKSIREYVNFDVDLDNKTIPGLVVPVKVWFAGKNEVQVTGEAKDFSGAPYLVQQQISAHLYLIEMIKHTPEGKNGHFFFVGDEPSKALPENHTIWKAVKENSMLDLVPTDEIKKIEEYMKVHGVEPIFPH